MNTKDKLHILKKVIEELEGEIRNKIPKKDIKERAKTKGIDPSEVDELLDELILKEETNLFSDEEGKYKKEIVKKILEAKRRVDRGEYLSEEEVKKIMF